MFQLPGQGFSRILITREDEPRYEKTCGVRKHQFTNV